MKWEIFTQNDTDKVAEYTAFVLSHPVGNFLQSPQWAKVKDAWRWRGINVYDEEKIVGTMGVLIRPLPMGYSLLYAPRGPVCDRSNKAVMEAMLAAAKELASTCKGLVLYVDPDELDTNEEFRGVMQSLGFDEQSSDGFGNIQPQFVFRLPIKDMTADEVFAQFNQKTRYNVRLSGRRGVTVQKFGGENEIPDAELTAFSTLMDTTGERDGFTVRGKEYFRQLLAALGEHSALYVAYLEGEPIAATIAVYYGCKTWYLYGASSNEKRDAMPNYALQWSMIQDAVALGHEIYDFRGISGDLSEDNPLYGLYRFKKGFNPVYTKFTGLFVYRFRPLMSRVLLFAMEHRGKLGGLLKLVKK